MRACRCWGCRRRRGLGEIAPTLVRAYRAGIEHAAYRRELRDHIRRAERLVAHRELQLVRAGHTRSRRYIDKRTKLLQDAQKVLERYQRRFEAAV